MRNLKKILALVLALMMVLSVMVTASAASPLEKFSDVEDVNPDYLEAVTVMVAAGVLNGTDKGLEPQTVLTREQAAVLVTYLATAGNTADYAAKCETEYDDVTATHWASGFINYCYENELILGTGDNKYSPKLSLTYEQYAAMLLRVLGIDCSTTGKWNVPVRNNAKSEGIMAGIESYVWTAELTREAACQMTFNALNWVAEGAIVTGNYVVEAAAGVTDPTKLAKIAIAAEESFPSRADALVYMSALGLTLATDYNIVAEAGNAGGLMDNFVEKVYTLDGQYDEFGRPLTNVWFEAENNTIIYSEEVAPVKTYTGAVDYKTIQADLKGYKLGGVKVEGTATLPNTPLAVFSGNNGTVNPTIGASTVTPSARLAALTSNGNVLEIYADANKNIIGINRILYTAAEIEISRPDANGTVTYTIGTDTYKDYTDEYIAAEAAKGSVKADEIVLNGEIAHEDHITYVVLDGVAQVYATETVEGILSRKTATGSYLTIGGEKIAVGANALTAYGSYNIAATAQKFVLDQYGYVIDLYTDGTPATVNSTNYVYVMQVQTQAYSAGGASVPGSLIDTTVTGAKDGVAVAEVVFADGTYAVINLALTEVKDIYGTLTGHKYAAPAADGTVTANTAVSTATTPIGTWFAYTTTEDGDYVLEALGGAAKRLTLGTNVSWTDENTVGNTINGMYITSTTKMTALKIVNNQVVVTDLTGKDFATGAHSTNKFMYTVDATNGTVTNMFFYDYVPAAGAPAPDYVYVVALGDQVGTSAYEYSVYMNGELTTITVGTNTYTEGDLLTVAGIDSYGVYTLASAGSLTSAAKVTVTDKTFFLAGAKYTYAEDCEIYNITTGATGAADVVEVGDYVQVLVVSGETVLVYIVDKPEA